MRGGALAIGLAAGLATAIAGCAAAHAAAQPAQAHAHAAHSGGAHAHPTLLHMGPTDGINLRVLTASTVLLIGFTVVFEAGPSSTTTILGRFQASLPNSNQTSCMLNRQRELTLLRPTATTTATNSA